MTESFGTVRGYYSCMKRLSRSLLLAITSCIVLPMPSALADDIEVPIPTVEDVSPSIARDLEPVTVSVSGVRLDNVDDVTVTVAGINSYVYNWEPETLLTGTIEFEMPMSWRWGWAAPEDFLDATGVDLPMPYDDFVAELAEQLTVDLVIDLIRNDDDNDTLTGEITFAPPAMMQSEHLLVGGCGDSSGEFDSFSATASIMPWGNLATFYMKDLDELWRPTSFVEGTCNPSIDPWDGADPYSDDVVVPATGVYPLAEGDGWHEPTALVVRSGYDDSEDADWHRNDRRAAAGWMDHDDMLGIIEDSYFYDNGYFNDTHLDYSDFVVTEVWDGVAVGYGTLASTTTVQLWQECPGGCEVIEPIDVVSMTNRYTLEGDASIIQVVTSFESDDGISNLNMWTGIGDNWLLDIDGTDVTRGHLGDDGFVASTTETEPSSIVWASVDGAFAFFYSPDPEVGTRLHPDCCGPWLLDSEPPESVPVSAVEWDAVYGLYVPFGDLEAGVPVERVWYIGAGTLNQGDLVQALLEAESDPQAPPVSGCGSTRCARRLEGRDRYETSAAVSQQFYPSGSSTVFVASGEDFPDALVAGAVAPGRGPILLVGAHSISASVEVELRRLDPTSVIIVGGEAAIDADVARAIAELTGADLVRLGGVDRYDTSTILARHFFGDGANDVFMASGTSFADALMAGVASHGASPVLLASDVVPPAVLDELSRLAPSRITLVGGPSSLPASIETEISSRVSASVARIGGIDRYETSALTVGASVDSEIDRVLLATGTDYPDALVASGVGYPVLLVHGDCLDSSTHAELNRLDTAIVQIIGGYDAVSPDLRRLEKCRG